ncbi:MAG: hypothetical protein KDB48_06100 [Solirubrobacterales bacterium]|nr:hypothetical protein [Solirubrobacterales bacterium]HMT05247.1 hypothetical protein [Solirubrobacterales bacterium]
MERISQSKLFRGLVLALAVAVSGLVLSACGANHEEKHGIVEGEPVALGDLEYNVLFTRPLNINDVEDSEYLVGKQEAPADKMWIGVFVKIHNTSEDEAHQIPEAFEIETTAGVRYTNIPSESIYALQPGTTVEPEGNIPVIDSTPQVGPIQASMLLYLIDRESAEQRPVELIIEGEDGPATVELDL